MAFPNTIPYDSIPFQLSKKAAQGQGEVKQCHSDWIAGPNGACYYLPANPEKTWGDFFFAQNSCHDKGKFIKIWVTDCRSVRQ